MKINAVISKPALKVNSADKTAIISAVIIAVGIIAGTVVFIFSKDTAVDSLCDYFLAFTSDFTNKNKPEIISGLILSNIPYFIMMLILGTSVIGVPGIAVLTFAKSMGIGLLVTYIYDSFALKGIEYCLLVLLPGKILLVFAMILLTQSCYVTSGNIRTSLYDKETAEPLHKFAVRSLVILLLFLASSVVDYFTLTGFSSLFKFT